MEIDKATWSKLSAVNEIVQSTIDKVYPKYYPAGAVDFFKKHHSIPNISDDLRNGYIYLLSVNKNPVATVTIKENHILRLFVLTEFQHKGYGRKLLDFAENMISGIYPECVADASFPAKSIYLRRGYAEKEYHTVRTDNGDYLCYDVMAKKL